VKEIDFVGDLLLFGRMTSKWFWKKWDVNRIEIAEDKISWRGFLSTVMNLRVP
jgi:hypothetical protein